jgi:hypothetical protein
MKTPGHFSAAINNVGSLQADMLARRDDCRPDLKLVEAAVPQNCAILGRCDSPVQHLEDFQD